MWARGLVGVAVILGATGCFSMTMTKDTLVHRRDFNTAYQPPLLGQSAAGAAMVKLPFIYRLPLAGWGAFGSARLTQENDIPSRQLKARVLVLQDPQGNRVALIATDLHGGSRYITEYVAARLADEGFHAGNIFFSATHNHAGPGGLYASLYFDAMMASTAMMKTPQDEERISFNKDLADRIGELVIQTIREATDSAHLRPAVVGFGSERYGMTFNRSLDAFLKNFQDAAAAQSEVNSVFSQNAPNATDLERYAVDPNVYTVAAFEPDGGMPLIGSFTTVNAHNALLHRDTKYQSADFFGEAASHAELAEQSRAFSSPAPVVGLAAGAQGDVDPIEDNTSLDDFDRHRKDDVAAMRTNVSSPNLLVAKFGRELGARVTDSIEKARAAAQPLTAVRVAFSEVVAADRLVNGTDRTARNAKVGRASFAGSELGRGPKCLFKEGMVSTFEPQHSPKDTRACGWAVLPQKASRRLLEYQDTRFPLRLVELQTSTGTARILGVAGEPTTWLAHLLRQEFSAGTSLSMISGVTGDYQGYLTTAAEYELQHYEGGSTIWGKHTEALLTTETRALAAQLAAGTLATPAAGPVTFQFSLETWLNRIDLNGNGCFGPPQSRNCLDYYLLQVGGARSAEAQAQIFDLLHEVPE